MGDISIKGRSKLLGGGRVGFKSGGRVGLKAGGRTGKQFGGPLARPGAMPARPLGLKDVGRTGFDKGQRVKEDSYKHKGTLEKEYEKIMGKKRDLGSADKALFALQPMDAGYKFRKGLKKKGYKPKKIEEDILVEKMKTKEFRIGKDAPGTTVDRGYGEEDKYRVYKKGGKVGLKK